MERTKYILAAAGLATGVIFGISGSLVSPQMAIAFYEISSVGLTAACVILALNFYRKEEDLVASGFLLFAIAEAVMSGGTSAGEIAGQPAFGAGMALYVPAFLLISIPGKFPLWNRLSGIATAIPFGIAAAIIFSGGQVLSSSGLAGAGYGLLSLTTIGWIINLLGENKESRQSQSPILEGQR